MLKLPRDDLEKVKVLEKVVVSFEKAREYNEVEVSDILKSLDLDDYVLFRRELVNFNFLGKDSYKGIYWVKTYTLSDADLEKVGLNSKFIEEMDD